MLCNPQMFAPSSIMEFTKVRQNEQELNFIKPGWLCTLATGLCGILKNVAKKVMWNKVIFKFSFRHPPRLLSCMTGFVL